MPVLLLLFLTLACLPERWPAPLAWFADPLRGIVFAWLAVLVEVSFAAILSRWARLAVQSQQQGREAILQSFLRGRRYHTLGLFLSYGLALYLFGYGWSIHTVWNHDGVVLPGAEILLLAPFFASLILSWACFYSAEKAFWHDSNCPEPTRPFFTRPAFVWFHLRQNLVLVFLPIVLLVGEKELRKFFPGFDQSWQFQASVAGIVIAVTVFVTMPWILRIVLGLRPLPEGPLRDRLLAASRRLGFRCSDLLVWNTHSGVANAMVVGLFPFLRYVLFTDRLLEELTPDEVEGVLGHEVGHVKHQHMLFYLVFLLASMMALGLLLMPYQPQLVEWFNLSERSDLAVLPTVASLGLYIFLVFGFLSRRCERQADIYGCRAVSCGNPACAGHTIGQPLPASECGLCPSGVRTFIHALERVAELNGISREKPGFLQWWQHSTIACRVEFLQGLLRDPLGEACFQKRVFLVKCGLFAVLTTILATQFVC